MAASRITCTPSQVVADGTRTVQIKITRDSTAYTHDLMYGTGENPTMFTVIAYGVDTSYTWTVPAAAWVSSGSAHSGVVTIRMLTKNGNEYIGRTDAKLTIVDDASFGPEVTSITMTDTPAASYIGNQYDVIGGLSVKNVTVTIKTKYYATVNGTPTITNSGKTKNLTQKSKTTTNGVTTYTYTATLENMTDAKYLVNVRDTREYGAVNSKSGTFTDYSKPTIEKFKLTRSTGLSDKLSISASGTWFGTPVGTKTNTLKVTSIQYKMYGEESYTTLTDKPTITIYGKNWTIGETELSGTFDHSKSAQFKLTISDDLSSVEREVYVSEGYPLFGWNQEHLFAFKPLFLLGGEEATSFARLTGEIISGAVVSDDTRGVRLIRVYRRGGTAFVVYFGSTQSVIPAGAEVRIGYFTDETSSHKFLPRFANEDLTTELYLCFPAIGVTDQGKGYLFNLEIRSTGTTIEVYMKNVSGEDVPAITRLRGTISYNCRY